MAKKKADNDGAADSQEPVAPVETETAPDDSQIVRDDFGRIVIGPVLCDGIRYEGVPHKRAYHLVIAGRECHHVGDDGDVREYRPLGRR